MALEVTVVASGGLPVIETPYGLPIVDDGPNGFLVTFSTNGFGLPVQFVGGIAPAGFVLLLGADGAQLLGADGAPLYGAA